MSDLEIDIYLDVKDILVGSNLTPSVKCGVVMLVVDGKYSGEKSGAFE